MQADHKAATSDSDMSSFKATMILVLCVIFCIAFGGLLMLGTAQMITDEREYNESVVDIRCGADGGGQEGMPELQPDDDICVMQLPTRQVFSRAQATMRSKELSWSVDWQIGQSPELGQALDLEVVQPDETLAYFSASALRKSTGRVHITLQLSGPEGDKVFNTNLKVK